MGTIEPTNHRLKLPVLILGAATGAASLAHGHYLFGGLGLIASAVAAMVVMRGRNPWWLRWSLDPRAPQRRLNGRR
jgi:hypothetical protein